MTLIEKISRAADKKCDELISKYPDVWYHLDGYRALIWLTEWGKSGGRDVHPEYIITKGLKCVHLDYYSFRQYLNDVLKIKSENIGYAEKQLRDQHWQSYTNYCINNNLLAEVK